MPTAQELKIQAGDFTAWGRHEDALLLYRRVLKAAPDDIDSWFGAAGAMDALGGKVQAGKLFSSIAMTWSRIGNPVGALVAALRAGELQLDTGPIMRNIMKRYSADSTVLGRSALPAPPDLEVEAPEEKVDVPLGELMEATLDSGIEVMGKAPVAEHVPPVPFLSELVPEAFNVLAQSATVKSYSRGEIIVSEGQPGRAVYMLGRGTVGVVRNLEAQESTLLAELGPGAFFGEVALVADQPRTASVVARTAVDLVIIERESVQELIKSSPEAADALLRFTRNRLLQNIMNTNPLFTAFPREERHQLLSKFEAHELEPQTRIIREGEDGLGLYLILAGEVQVSKTLDNGEARHLATLHTGDTFGEISLVIKCRTTATATTLNKSTILFLPREYFWALLDAVPDIKARFQELAQRRLEDSQLMMLQDTVVDDDFFEEIEEIEEDELHEEIVIF